MEYLLLLLVVPFLFGDFFGGGSEDAPDINGTDGNDTLFGTETAEEINAGAGDDAVAAWSGDDTVNAGDGEDVVLGENGNDLIFGGAGDDVFNGGAGNDTIWLGDGDDELVDSSFVSDFDIGSEGDDRISGGDGNDGFGDWSGSDTLTGELGRDFVNTIDMPGTEDAPDVNSGGWGIDTLYADDGDTMSGGGNTDEFHVYVDSDIETDRAVTISDFDSATETIELDLFSESLASTGPSDLLIETDPVSGDVTISVAGQQIAVVINPGSFDASNVVVPNWASVA